MFSKATVSLLEVQRGNVDYVETCFTCRINVICNEQWSNEQQ
jgi:hypothetical protein